jgi:hypothetical protein
MSDDTTTTSAPAATETPIASASPETAAPTTEASPSIPRPLEVIRIEYTNLCARLGQLVYNMGQAEEEKADILNAIFQRVKEERDLPESMKNVPVPPLAPVPPAQA